MKTKNVSKFNFWASKPKKVKSTRTMQDAISKEKIYRNEFAAICQSGPCD